MDRSLIVAKVVPSAEARVAEIFAESDATELPRLVGVRHRSLYRLGDLYVHLLETESPGGGAVEAARGHPEFARVECPAAAVRVAVPADVAGAARRDGPLLLPLRRRARRAAVVTATAPREGQLWSRCGGCATLLYRKRLRRNLDVCPECGAHARVDAPERLLQLVDPGSLTALPERPAEVDPLGFTDPLPYPHRLAAARAGTGLAEAVVCGPAAVGGPAGRRSP